MRVKVLFLVLLIAFVGMPRLGYAEKVRTNQRAKVFNRPGEQGKVLVKLKEGQVVTVLAQEGRWLKVRAGGRTGYVPRTVVDMPTEGKVVRNTRRRPFVDGRGTRRGFGGNSSAPEDRIGADATGDLDVGGDDDDDDDDDPEAADRGDDDDDDDDDDLDDEEEDDRLRARVSKRTALYDEPDDESEESYEASPKDVLYVLEQQGKWTLVETDEGDVGYIETDKLEIQRGGKGGKGGATIDLRGRLGVTIMSQSLTSAGGAATWPDVYKLGSSAATVALGGAVMFPYKADFVVGGEITWDIARAVPGIAFDPDGAMGPLPAKTTGFTLHNFNLRAVGGYDFKKQNGMVALGRLGYHYASFLVANVTNLTENNARLPSEVIQGPMIGAALAIPRLTDKIGLRVSVDALIVAGRVSQTANLEDGADPSAKRYSVGGLFSYRWRPEIDIQAGYDLNYTSVQFGAPVPTSMRMHGAMVTSVARTDLSHTVTVGVAKAF